MKAMSRCSVDISDLSLTTIQSISLLICLPWVYRLNHLLPIPPVVREISPREPDTPSTCHTTRHSHGKYPHSKHHGSNLHLFRDPVGLSKTHSAIDRGLPTCRDEFGLTARGFGCVRHSDRRYVLEQSTLVFRWRLLCAMYWRLLAWIPSVQRDHNLLCIYTDILVEVNRALDNLNKSGKLFSLPSRRDSMPMMGGPRAFSDFGAYSIIPHRFVFSKHLLQTPVWAVYHSVTTLSATSIRSGPILAQTSKPSTQTSGTNQDQTKQSRCFKPSVAWLRNVSVNCATTIKSNSTTEVSFVGLSCGWLLLT